MSRADSSILECPINIASPGFIDDPYPHYRELRTSVKPCWYEPLSAWLVSRYKPCRAILRDSGAFSSDFRKVGLATDPAIVSLQTLDPPEQLAVRRPLKSAFNSSFTAPLRQLINLEVNRLILSTQSDKTIDFVHDFAMPISTFATLSLMGLQEDQQRLAQLSEAIVKSMMAGLDPEAEEPGAASRAELAELLDLRTKTTRPLGFLHHAFDEAGLSSAPRDHALNSTRVILLAGINSSQRYLSNGLLALLQSTYGLEYLRKHPNQGLMLDELARYDAPVQAQTKVALRDVVIDGQAIRRGEQLVAFIGSANRDESVFTKPDRLMLERTPNPHLAFGSGTHLCFGAPFAKFLARSVLFTLATHYPDTAVVESPVREQNPTLRGLLKLPIRLM